MQNSDERKMLKNCSQLQFTFSPNERNSDKIKGFRLRVEESVSRQWAVGNEEKALRQKFREVMNRRKKGNLLPYHNDWPSGDVTYPKKGESYVIALDPERTRRFDDAFQCVEEEDGSVTLRVHVIDVLSLLRPEWDKKAQTTLQEMHTVTGDRDNKILLLEEEARDSLTFSTQTAKPAFTVEVSYNPQKESLGEVVKDPTRLRLHRSRVRLTHCVSHEGFLNTVKSKNYSSATGAMKVCLRVSQLVKDALKGSDRLAALETTTEVSAFCMGKFIAIDYSLLYNEARVILKFLLKSVFAKAFANLLESHPQPDRVPCCLPYGQCKEMLKENKALFDLLCRYFPESELIKRTLSQADDYILVQTGVTLMEFVECVDKEVYQQCFNAHGEYRTLSDALKEGWRYTFEVNRPARDYFSIVALELSMEVMEGRESRWTKESIQSLISDGDQLIQIVNQFEKLGKEVLGLAASAGASIVLPCFILQRNNKAEYFTPSLRSTPILSLSSNNDNRTLEKVRLVLTKQSGVRDERILVQKAL